MDTFTSWEEPFAACACWVCLQDDVSSSALTESVQRLWSECWAVANKQYFHSLASRPYSRRRKSDGRHPWRIASSVLSEWITIILWYGPLFQSAAELHRFFPLASPQQCNKMTCTLHRLLNALVCHSVMRRSMGPFLKQPSVAKKVALAGMSKQHKAEQFVLARSRDRAEFEILWN